jgi:hypothetical protein
MDSILAAFTRFDTVNVRTGTGVYSDLFLPFFFSGGVGMASSSIVINDGDCLSDVLTSIVVELVGLIPQLPSKYRAVGDYQLQTCIVRGVTQVAPCFMLAFVSGQLPYQMGFYFDTVSHRPLAFVA